MSGKLSIKEIEENEIVYISNYWLKSNKVFLESMGVNVKKLPSEIDFTTMLSEQIKKPTEEKNSYCLLWLLDGKPVGHSNTNPTQYGDHAYMHLHIWDKEHRRKGYGIQFLRLTIARFFEVLKINTLYSQPYSKNPAPNKTLEKLGFQLVEETITVPGSINYLQQVKKWALKKEDFKALNK